VSRREAALSAVAVLAAAVTVGLWARTVIVFPRPEDVAYYVGVARNLLEGRGLTSDAIWSFQTPPLAFPRPAFEVWLPLPTLLAAIPMALIGATFAAAQVFSVATGALVAVLAWRLAADVAAELALPLGRARTLAFGAGFTTAVYLPVVLASAQPDSTAPFAALTLAACLLMTRIARGDRRLVALGGLGLVLGLAALTRNEATWLALAWAALAWGLPAGSAATSARRPRVRDWLGLVVPPAVVALLVFAPWAIRDWQAFGSPFPGQALTNALSLDGRDIFAWQERPTLERYLGAGIPTLLGLRWTGFVHNLVAVLLLLGVPVSVLGLAGLPAAARLSALRPLLVFAAITFAVATLLFPVSTTWGTFLHAAGAIHVLLIVSALLVLDRAIVWVGRRRGWTRPVAWLGPAFSIAAGLLFTSVLLAADGRNARASAATFEALPAAFEAAGFPLDAEPGPVITDFPIWFAEATRHRALALPNEPPSSILDLAGSFDPPARLLVVDAGNSGVWPGVILAGGPGADCFVPIELPDPADRPGALDSVLAYRIRCP
jgi:hypothetical protein